MPLLIFSLVLFSSFANAEPVALDLISMGENFSSGKSTIVLIFAALFAVGALYVIGLKIYDLFVPAPVAEVEIDYADEEEFEDPFSDHEFDQRPSIFDGAEFEPYQSSQGFDDDSFDEYLAKRNGE